MFRHLPNRRNLSATAVVLCLALAGCSDDKPQEQIDSLRSSLAAVSAEVASLRASRHVLQNRLAAAQIAARTAGGQLAGMNSRVSGLSARNRALAIANAQGAQRLRAAEAAVDHVSGQLAAINQSVIASEFNNANLSRQLAAASSLLGQRDALGQSQENTLKTLAGDLRERSESMVDLSEELVTRQQSLQQAESKADQLRAQNEQIAAQLAALQSKSDTVRTRSAQRISQLERERGELDATISGMRTDSQEETVSAQQLLATNKQIKVRMETLRHELADANNQALRYQVAKDYLIDKVQAQDAEVDALKKAGNDARGQHTATMTTLLTQQDKLRASALTRGEVLNNTIARAKALQAEGDGFQDQLERLRGEYATSEQRARGAKQAKDYLDGKLSAIAKELEEARSEHRTALLKNDHALRLSLEESRVLQQRERGLSVQFQQTQEISKQKDAELRVLRDETDAKIKLARAAGLVDGKAEGRAEQEAELRALRDIVETKIERARDAAFVDGKTEGRDAGLNEGRAEQEVELRTLRDEVDAKIGLARAGGLVDGKAEGRDAGLIEGRAERKVELDACVSFRSASATTLRELILDNDSLSKEVSTLTTRLQALESEQNDCAVQKTQSSTKK
ncbi:MAG: hypothetical protein ACI9DC_003232 [Gammaproteobacteria bacterium]